MGWKFEYEPDLDIPGWIPDFKIETESGCEYIYSLFEIKPYDLRDKEQYEQAGTLAEANERKLKAAGARVDENGFLTIEVAVLGNGLVREYDNGSDVWIIGALSHGEGATIGDANYGRTQRWDYGSDLMSYAGRIYGEYDGNQLQCYKSEWERLWGEAKRKTRWELSK